MSEGDIYGWFDPRDPGVIAHDPPHCAPCLYCGLALTVDDVRTHSFTPTEGAETTYFYRTHRSCDEQALPGARQSMFGGVVQRLIADAVLD